MNNAKVVVVGGAGFVGSNLVRLLLKENKEIKITAIDNLLSSEADNLPKDERLTFIEGSITNDDVLATIHDDVDYIFHLNKRRRRMNWFQVQT
jgi:nucleoside-diphosphate-sugar epimerase